MSIFIKPQNLDSGLGAFANAFAQEAIPRFQQAYENQMISQALQGVQNPMDALQRINTLNISPQAKQIAYQNISGQHEMQQAQQKQMFEQNQLMAKRQQNESILRDMEKRRGLEPGSLQAYVDNPQLAQTVSKPEKGYKPTQASQPIDPDQLKRIQNVRNMPGYAEASPTKKYQMLTDAGVSKENAQAESDLYAKEAEIHEKKIETGYKASEDFRNKTVNAYQAWETETKPVLQYLQKLDENDLMKPATFVALDKLGLPTGIFEGNATSEAYEKASQSLLKGLPETFGTRILQVEVQNFLRTIPTLRNSAEGRKLIIANMLKLGEMRESLYKQMTSMEDSYINENKPLPRNFHNKVLDATLPKIQKIQQEFIQLADLDPKSIPNDAVPVFDENGILRYANKNDPGFLEWMVKSKEEGGGGGKRIW